MMNGRQRSPRGISSHESGSTTMKKIAKVAVGKSTEARREGRRAMSRRRLLAGLRWRQARCGRCCRRRRLERRVARSGRTTTDPRDRCGRRDGAVHERFARVSIEPPSTPRARRGATLRPSRATTAGASSPADGREYSHRDQEEDLEQEPRDGGASGGRRIERAHPGGLSRWTGIRRPSRAAPRLGAGASGSARAACGALPGALPPARRARERRRAAPRFLVGRLVRDLRRLGRVRHGSPVSPRRWASSRRALPGLVRGRPRGARRPSLPVSRRPRPARRIPRLGELLCSSSAGSSAAVAGGDDGGARFRPSGA